MIQKIFVSVLLVVGFFFFAQNIEIIYPHPEEIIVCGWWDVCVPNVPINLANHTQWVFNVLLIQITSAIITILIITFIWTVGIPGSIGGRFSGALKK